MHTKSPVGPDRVPWAGWVCLAAVGLLLCCLSIQKIWAADIWWQLRTGEWILAHHAVPRHDTLSYTVPGHEWIEMRWLFCVLAYLVWKAGGPSLLILAQTLVLAVAYSLILAPLRRTAVTLPGVVVAILGVASAASRFVPRPELVSYLLVPLFLLVLDGRARGRFRRSVWLLPLVQVLWTNAHTVFIFGPVLAWLFAGGDVIRRFMSRSRTAGPRASIVDLRFVLLVALITAACLVNPYGLRGALFPFTLFREIHKGSVLGSTIKEFISPFSLPAWSWDLYVASAFVLVAGATFLINRRRTDPARLAIWASFVYLAGVSLRNVAPLALVTTWATLRNLEEILAARPAHEGTAREHERGAARRSARGGGPRSGRRWAGLVAGAAHPRSPIWHLALASALVLACWYVVSDRFYVRMGAPRRFGLGVVEWHTPAAATRFALEAEARPQAFHSLADGSYLTWAANDRFPVYIDGRLEVYGEEFLARYHTLADRDLLRLADEQGVNTMILEREYFRTLVLAVVSSPKWVLVHLDPRDLVFVRDIPEHTELIRRYRIDPFRPWVPREPEPDEIPSGWRRWIGSVEQPWYSYSMAKNFLALGSASNAVRFLELGLSRFPDHDEMKQLLEKVRRHTGEPGR